MEKLNQQKYTKMYNKEIILDTNIFVLYIIGLINPAKISKHRRTSAYNKDSFEDLKLILSNFGRIIICPNIVTEIDNLLNNDLYGDDKFEYFKVLNSILKNSIEKYVKSCRVIEKLEFQYVGLTDAVLLEMAKNCNLLVSGDSELCDIARSNNINVFDFKKHVNDKYYS